MAARSFDQILAEVSAKSDPQRKIVLDQVASLPTQQAADEASLEAKRAQANEDIITAARRRGTGIALGGIPLGEQNKYAQTEYAPAVANLKAGYNTRRGTLESALADIGRSDYMGAQDIFDRDRTFYEQQRQFNEQIAAQQRAAAAARAIPTLGGVGGNGGGRVQPEKTYIGNDDFRGRLAYEANKGNADARLALKYAGNDGRYDGPVTSPAEFAALRNIGVIGNYYIPGLSGGGSGTGIIGLPSGVKF